MMMILIISAAGFLLLLGLVLFVLRRRPAWLAAVIALTASGVLLLFSLTGAISKPIIIEIPDGVDEAEANAIVELVLKREYLSVLYGPGFRDYWLGNIKLLSISGTNGLIELVLIDTFNWKS